MSGRSFKEDYAKGKSNEKKVLEIIRKYFNDDIKQVGGVYSPNDYKGKTRRYELKSRNIEYKRYPTIMIGKNKLIKDIVLLFLFTDGLYYIEYEEEEFKNFEGGTFQREERVDKIDMASHVVYIPMDKLKRIPDGI